MTKCLLVLKPLCSDAVNPRLGKTKDAPNREQLTFQWQKPNNKQREKFTSQKQISCLNDINRAIPQKGSKGGARQWPLRGDDTWAETYVGKNQSCRSCAGGLWALKRGLPEEKKGEINEKRNARFHWKMKMYSEFMVWSFEKNPFWRIKICILSP